VFEVKVKMVMVNVVTAKVKVMVTKVKVTMVMVKVVPVKIKVIVVKVKVTMVEVKVVPVEIHDVEEGVAPENLAVKADSNAAADHTVTTSDH